MERSYSVTETSRSVALAALMRIDHDGAYANLVLPALLSRSKLSDPDRRFVTELVYGTTRMRRACDALIDRFVVSEPDDATRTLLRLGAYQLVFAGVAPHACSFGDCRFSNAQNQWFRECSSAQSFNGHDDLAK